MDSIVTYEVNGIKIPVKTNTLLINLLLKKITVTEKVDIEKAKEILETRTKNAISNSL